MTEPIPLATGQHLARYPAGDAANPTDGYVWTYDATGGGWRSEKMTPARIGARPAEAVSVDVSRVNAPNARSPLSIPSYDGSGDVVHPSVHYDPQGWNGYRYWMAMTPLPGSNSDFENPSIVASNDGLSWEVPPGLTNPVEPAPATGYNSDTELVREGDTLHMIFRYEDTASTNYFYLRSSTDGVNWSEKVEIYRSGTATEYAVSPGIVWDDEQYAMYYVDISTSPNAVRMRTAASIEGPYSAPTAVTIPALSGRDWWHLSLIRLNDLYVMAIDDVPLNQAGGGGDLYLATSRDGLSWEVGARPAVPRGGNQQWDTNIYRAAIVPVQGASLSLGIYYSANSNTGWRIGYTTAPLDRHTLDYRGVHEIYDAYLVALLASFKKLGPYVFGDAFDRADSTTALGTSTSGDAWTAISGALGIQSGEVYAPATGNNRSFVETGISEGRVEADFSGLPASSGEAWMFFRYADSANYLRFGVQNGVLRFQRVAANAVASNLIVSGAAPIAARLAVEYEGSEVRMFVDHRPLATVTDSNFTTATKVGLQIPNLTTRADDMTARRL